MTPTDTLAIITGAGTGIGRATALRFSANGVRVLAIGRREEPLVRLAADAPGPVDALPLDVSDPDAVAAALADLPPVDALVLNHGVCSTTRHDSADALAIWRRTMAINLDGAFYMLRAVSPRLVDGGRVVAISSGLGKLGRAGKAAYAASKHGLLGLMRSVAPELADRRITVKDRKSVV